MINFCNNHLTSVNLTGCIQLKEIYFNNNDMPSDLVDDILHQVNSFGTSDGKLELVNNQPPSITGLGYKADLESRGWKVKLIQIDNTFADGSSFTQTLTPNSSNQVIGRFMLTPASAGSALTSAVIKLDGLRSGLSNFKLWTSVDASFGEDTQLGITVVSDPGDGRQITFQSFSSSISTDGSYYFLTADLSSSASGYIQGVVVQPQDITIYNGSVTNYFTNALLSDGTAPLPVKLGSFTAQLAEGKVLLNWNTVTEIDNYGFEVERSLVTGHQALANWEKVGFVEGSGNSNSPKEYSFTDDLTKTSDVFKNLGGLATGNIQYRLKQIDTDGGFEYYGTIAEVNYNLTDVKEIKLPTEYSLEQNYPNPFNPVTIIRYAIPAPLSLLRRGAGGEVVNQAENGPVTLKVYDILGNEVATLVNESKAPGYYEVNFNAGNLSTGVYIYRLNAGSYTYIKSAVHLKGEPHFIYCTLNGISCKYFFYILLRQ